MEIAVPKQANRPLAQKRADRAMSLTKMMAWAEFGHWSLRREPLLARRARRGLSCEAWITSGYTASIKCGHPARAPRIPESGKPSTGQDPHADDDDRGNHDHQQDHPGTTRSLRADPMLRCQCFDGIFRLLETNPGLFSVNLDGRIFFWSRMRARTWPSRLFGSTPMFSTDSPLLRAIGRPAANASTASLASLSPLPVSCR